MKRQEYHCLFQMIENAAKKKQGEKRKGDFLGGGEGCEETPMIFSIKS